MVARTDVRNVTPFLALFEEPATFRGLGTVDEVREKIIAVLARTPRAFAEVNPDEILRAIGIEP